MRCSASWLTCCKQGWTLTTIVELGWRHLRQSVVTNKNRIIGYIHSLLTNVQERSALTIEDILIPYNTVQNKPVVTTVSKTSSIHLAVLIKQRLARMQWQTLGYRICHAIAYDLHKLMGRVIKMVCCILSDLNVSVIALLCVI